MRRSRDHCNRLPTFRSIVICFNVATDLVFQLSPPHKYERPVVAKIFRRLKQCWNTSVGRVSALEKQNLLLRMQCSTPMQAPVITWWRHALDDIREKHCFWKVRVLFLVE